MTVKTKVQELRKKIETLNSHHKRVMELKDSFKGERCYVISCGPTLTEHDQEALEEVLKNNLVIAVKQSFDLFPQHVDFHTYNCANFKRYDYSKNKPIVVESAATQHQIGECHIKFFIDNSNFDNSISKTKEFEKGTYENSINFRPYGPGIMYESVFYLAQHLGVSEIITVGWDNYLVKGKGPYQHFYDKEGSNYERKNFIHHNAVADNLNAVQSLPYEEKITSDAIGPFANWLKSKGVALKIVSSLNPAPDFIERVEIQN